MPMSMMEMVTEIVAGQSSQRVLSAEEITALIRETYRALKEIETLETRGATMGEGDASSAARSLTPQVSQSEMGESISTPKIDPRESIRQDDIVCLVCGEAYKTISHTHLARHGLTPDQYRRKYGFPKKQPLAARSVSERRRSTASERGVGERLKAARAARRSDQSMRTGGDEQKGEN